MAADPGAGSSDDLGDDSSIDIYLADDAATRALGRRLAAALPGNTAGWTFLLQGELGAGKSTLARALIRALGHPGPIPSPTYTLVEPYELPAGKVYHIDLYRVTDSGELAFLGWTELDDGLRLIEWPDRAADALGNADLRIELSYRDEGRQATLSALSRRGRELLKMA